MKERVVEILILLMSELQGEKQLAEVDMSELQDRGYTSSEITRRSAGCTIIMQQGTEATPLPGKDRVPGGSSTRRKKGCSRPKARAI